MKSKKTKPNKQQEGLYNLFTKYARDDGTIHDDGFKARVEALRASESNILHSTYEIIEEFEDGNVNHKETPSPLNQLMYDYKFPSAMNDFIYHYVVNNEVDISKLRTGVYILDDSEMLASGDSSDEDNYKDYVRDQEYTKYAYVRLAIPVDATSLQITKTLKSYKKFIYERQELVRGSKRTYKRAHYLAERDNMLLNLSEQGYKPKEIEKMLSKKWQGQLLSYQIAKIISRAKKKRK